jgi:hypothetical protein
MVSILGRLRRIKRNSVESEAGSRQAQHQQIPPGCDRRRPFSSDLAESGEVVISVHGEEFTVEEICQEVTVSQPVGPGESVNGLTESAGCTSETRAVKG